MITMFALAIIVVLFPIVVHDLVRKPTIRRLGLRNVVRRRGEAALVVGGSMLATALIVASFIIGSSFDQSIRNVAETRLGPVDEIVLVDQPEQLGALADALLADTSGEIDGVLPVISAEVAVASVATDSADRRVEPRADLLEMDLGRAATFGGDPASTGFDDVTDPPVGTAVINRELADEIGVARGDEIDLFLGGSPVRLAIHGVVEAEGLAGFAEIVVAPGSVAPALAARPHAGGDLAIEAIAPSALLVSNSGGVFDGATGSQVVESIIIAESEALDLSSSVLLVKADLLAEAEAEGASMTELFGTIGGFSVIAGILLVINLFVMLASERTIELGTMRAVGLKRTTILRVFALEGAIYGVVASVVGAVLGIGIGAGVIGFASTLFDGDGFDMSLSVTAMDLLAGGAIGLAISQLTVVITSSRTTRINIVRALKDLGPQAVTGRRWRRVVLSLSGVVAGSGIFIFAPDNALAAMAGPVIAVIAAIGLLGLVVPAKLATVIGCSAALVWPVAVFGARSETMDNPDVGVFLLQGVLLVGLATALLASLDRVWLGAVGAMAPSGVAPRLGLAHPLARPVRSALLVAMYALVIFTVTFIAILNSAFKASAPELAAQVGGQFDMVVESNRTSPLRADQLLDVDGVGAVSEIRRGFVDVVDGERAADGWVVSTINSTWSTDLAPTLGARADEFDDDAGAWTAVASGDLWIMAPADEGFEVGQEVVLQTPSGPTTSVRVAGLVRNGWLVDAGLYVPDALAEELWVNEPPVSRHYVAMDAALPRAEIESEIQGRWPELGAETSTFLRQAEDALDEQEGFFQMLEGYLGFGLLIGIAGLGVVLIRSVRERRRELGMLAAIGVPVGQTRRAFLIEASFIGVQGVLLGIGLGLVSAWQVLTRTAAFEDDLTFDIPVLWLAGLMVIAVGASLGAAAIPARRAGRVPPAVALRVTG